MDIVVNKLENLQKIKIEKPQVRNNKTATSPETKKSKSDDLQISHEVKIFQNKMEESKKYMETMDKTETLTKEEVQKFQEKIKDYSQNFDTYEDKIVYSLMTLPAFRNISKLKESKPHKNPELDEIKRIQEVLQKDGEMEEVLEEAIKFLMKSLLS